MFRVCILKDSVSPAGDRAVSVAAQFPREVLAEMNTHTIISKSTSSSRAFPVGKMLETLNYVPEFGRNQKGMQAGDVMVGEDEYYARSIWETARVDAVRHASAMSSHGVHKQVTNRLIENFGWTRQILTSTQWANFFALRTHKDAHPAFQKIARLIFVAMMRSKPKPLNYGDWHLPLIEREDIESEDVQNIARDGWFPEEAMPLRDSFVSMFGQDTRPLVLCFMSAARCARASYNKIDGPGKTSLMDDWTTFRRLVVRNRSDDPVHVSPLGHQCTPMHKATVAGYPELISNLKGFIQFRKLIPNECAHSFRPTADTVAGWQVDESCIVTDPRTF